MNLKRILALSVALLPVAFAWSAFAQDPNAATELHLRGLDAQWSKVAGTKDLDKTVSYYADDAMVFAPNTPGATSKEAIRKVWKDLFDAPGASISWRTSRVEVAKSGDLAYVTGSYEAGMNDAAGKPVKEVGKYVAIFKKQADDKWKCIVDVWNADTPATPPAPEKKK
jgi:ketosteroid isomerase-like protein